MTKEALVPLDPCYTSPKYIERIANELQSLPEAFGIPIK